MHIPVTDVDPCATEEGFFLSLDCELLEGGFHIFSVCISGPADSAPGTEQTFSRVR